MAKGSEAVRRPPLKPSVPSFCKFPVSPHTTSIHYSRVDTRVLLSVVANRETYADGHQKTWLLIDTKNVEDPSAASKEYHLRTTIEERHRQLKCFIDLTKFTSRAFSMVVNQVVFIMLSYNLLQLYLLRRGRKEVNNKTLPRIRQQLLPSDNHIIVSGISCPRKMP